MTTLIALLCRITIAVAAEILHHQSRIDLALAVPF